MIPYQDTCIRFMKTAEPFWHENRIRGFHKGGMCPPGLICVSYKKQAPKFFTTVDDRAVTRACATKLL